MKKHGKKFLFFLILCSIFGEFISPTVLCKEQENIPISSGLGKTLKQLALNGKPELNKDEITDAFSDVDKRGNENEPAYALLRMNMDKVNKKTKRILALNEEYKGSGTVLYRSDDYILVLTAYHNLYSDDTRDPNYTLETSQMRLIKDNKDQDNPDDLVAEMVGHNYIQVAQKDVALIAMNLRLYEKDVFKNDKVIFDILDYKNTQQSGKANSVNAEINQYPTHFDWYIKTIGLAYHENGKGYHYIPTLPGASGSAVVIDSKIAGVHVSSGDSLPPDEVNIKYKNRNILVRNNIFELISLDEIKQESAKLGNNKDKKILADLIQGYIKVSHINQQRVKLTEYLKFGRKIDKDKDTDPEFLEAINKLNKEVKFWTLWYFWPEEIKEITDKVVAAYNAKEDL